MNDETQHSRQAAEPGDSSPPGADTIAGSSLPPRFDTIPQSPDQAAQAYALTGQSASPKFDVPGYEILGELGRGGMGVVYKARQLKLNRIVALKMVLGGRHADPKELIRFLAEAEAVAAIRHPHVIQIYDTGEADGRPFMAMECLEGGSLVDRLRGSGKLEPRAAAELVMKIARGVQAAHDRGIVHRDLKPHNVLLDHASKDSTAGTWGEPKVMDFGLAKRGGGAELTQTGAVMGTPAYMAPEQARGETKSIGPSADIYALGVILYECLSGTVPFKGEDPWAVIRQVVATEPQALSRRVRGIPRDLELICGKCLEKAPKDRYASAGALADDLQRFLNGESILGPRTGIWYSARRTTLRWWKPIAACGALAALSLSILLATTPWKNREPGEEAKSSNTEPPEENPLVKLRREEVYLRVESLRRINSTPDLASPYPVERHDELPKSDFSAFKVINDERIVDMRGWQPNPTNDPNILCTVVYHTKRELMKIAAADELRVEMRTSGRDIFMRAMRPNPERVKALAADKPGIVGKQAMKVRQLLFDVSDIPVNTEFTLQFSNTYLSSLQKPEEMWFGVIGYEGSFKTSMLMLFPDGRPFKTYQLRVAPTRVDDPNKLSEPELYTGPVIIFEGPDKSWLYWEIPSPKANYVYRVDWTW